MSEQHDSLEEIARLEARIRELESSSDVDDLQRRLAFVETMMEIVPVGLVVADETGRIVRGNQQTERMVRHPVLKSADASAYGEWVSHHEDGTRVQAHEYPLARILAGEDHAELEVCYQRGDQTTFWMRIIGEPVFDAEGQRIGAAVALIDIDEQRKLQRAQDILIGELNHRVKNAFSVTQAIVNRTLRKAGVADELRTDLDTRLFAYAQAHARLVGRKWGYAPLEEIAREIVIPIANDRITLSGPEVDLTSRLGISLSMAFYELATNAVKYGSLSAEDGTVALDWRIEGDRLLIDWVEHGGPPAIEPESTGFGSFVIGRGLMAETGGRTRLDFTEEGLRWSVDMPVPTNEKEIGFDG